MSERAGRPLIDVLAEEGLLDDVLGLDLDGGGRGGDDPCPHPDTFPALVEEGTFHSVVTWRCRVCDEQWTAYEPIGRHGASGPD